MTERNGHRSPVFIFPGQGTIFPRMTGELFQQCPQYAAHMTECADAFAPLLDWSIIDVITGSPSAPDHTRIDVIEPVLVAITISLARLWEDHGVKPAATIGYSLGEISAAGYLGTMSLAETAATTVAWTRAQLPLAGRGAMAVVGLSRVEADDLGNGISVAAELSPASVVVAGEAPAIEELTTDLRSRQRYAQRVSVTFAAHSPVVDEQRDDLLRLLQHSHHGDAPLPYYSALAGGRLHTAGLTPSHWYEVLRQPFNLNGAVQAALADGHDAFIDLAAHPGVATALTQIFTHRGADAVSVGTLRRDQQGLSRFLSAVNEAHDAGVATREVAAPTAGQDTDHDIDPGIAELLSVVTDRVSRDLSAATPAPATVDELRLLGENPRTVSMFDLGFTSMELILLQERLQHSTGVTLESTFVLDFSTIDQMVTEIQDRQRPSAEVTSTRPAAVSDEPIAIVGMSLRLPGGVRTREQLWTLLSEEIDPVAPLDPERWAHSPLDRSEITTTDGGYLDDVDQFAPLFFGISPKEAEAMDPQQRLLLELTWEALEDHGVDPFMVGKQQRVGTWMGLIPNDYLQVGKDLGHIPDAYTAIGAMSNVAVGRVSHVFGLDGPSIAIDAACASSAHAIHMACEALRHGVCETALAGAVNVMVSPEGHISFSRLQALSPSGRCRSFDAGADGYIRSEGGAVVVLKRLSDAERDGDNIIALVTGSAIAHNGGGGGFTVPSGTAQARVIREAMAQARLTVDDIDYLEAHGSGTPIGDPQEVNSMARVFADRREPLTVGSIKSNLGHLEAAAGMAGLSKVLTSMEHGAIPATLHLQQLNPLIDWATVPIRVADRLSPWSPQGDRRRAGISSFGLSGTNAHLIVEEYPSAERVAPEATVPSLIPLSANSPEALTEAVTSTTEWAASTSVAMADLSHTWGRRRALPHRQAIVASTADDLSRASVTPVAACDAVVMVFAGQGTQYPGMAHELYRTAPQFAAQLDRLDELFRQVGDFAVLDALLHGDEEAFASPLVNQPLLFSVELALAEYWRSLGITVDAVVGHSIGEYAAACFAGALTVEQAVRLVAHRATVMADTEPDGGMITLLCSLERAEELIAGHDDVAIAAINAAENITVSGGAESIATIHSAARKARIFVEPLATSHAFHSPRMEGSATRLAALLADETFTPPALTWVSTLTGDTVTSAIEPSHWVRHLVDPVLFTRALTAARGSSSPVFLEVGAMATLSALIAQQHDENTIAVPSLRKGRGDVQQFLETAGVLWQLGHDLSFTDLPGASGELLHDLPPRPFTRSRIWYSDRRDEGIAPMAPSTSLDPRSNLRDEVSDTLRETLHQITSVDLDDLQDSTELFALGVDSLMLVQLGNRIEKSFGVTIPVRTFFESLHTIAALIDHVVGELPADSPATAPAAAAPVAAPAPAAPPTPVAAPPAVPAVAAPATVSSDLAGIVAAQMDLMRQQLALLGGSPAPTTAPPTAAGVAACSTPPAAVAPAPTAAPARRAATKPTGNDNNISLADDELTDQQATMVESFVDSHVGRTGLSKNYTDAHRNTLADWIASLNFNPSLKETVYPIVSSRSQGAYFWDLDGNRYLDTTMGYGVHFFGHRPDFLVDALQEQLDKGWELGPQNAVVGEVSELIRELTGCDRVAFCNTGTEAVMVSLRLARAVTGRDKIVRFTSSFHGSSDGVLAEADGDGSMPMSIGITQSTIDDTMVLTYGSRTALDRIRAHAHELAAVLVEPVQTRNLELQPREFLVELREICDEHDIALIFDEIVVGFRVELRGAQSYFGVESDMSLYGKLVGGGMPIGIITGSSKYLDAVDGGAWSDVDDSVPSTPTTFFAGTFCKHPLTMATCRAVLRRLKEGGNEALADLNDRTHRFAEAVNAFFVAEQVPLRVSYFSSVYRYESLPAVDMASSALATNLFFKLLIHHGVYVWEKRIGFFTMAHTDDHIDEILTALKRSLAQLRAGGFDFRRAGADDSALEARSEDLVPFPAPHRPLSAQEKRMYILSQMRGGNEAYQVLTGLALAGPLPAARIDNAMWALARRHPLLRTSYQLQDGELRAVVADEVIPEVHHIDLREHPADSTVVLDTLNAPFDLATAPLWRYAHVTDTDGTQQLLMSWHHAIADGASMEILLSDLATHLSGTDLVEAEATSYRRFVEQQARESRSAAHSTARQWWLEQFATVPPAIELPTSGEFPEVNDFRGAHAQFELSPELTTRFQSVLTSHHLTSFAAHLAAWTITVTGLTGETEVCIGVPLDQRLTGDYASTVGMFAQTLPLRIALQPGETFVELAARIRTLVMTAVEHTAFSYDELVDELDLPRDPRRNALFDVMFTVNNARHWATDLGGVAAEPITVAGNHTTVWLNLEITEHRDGVSGDLIHTDVLDAADADAITRRYRHVLDQVTRDPNLPVDALALVDTAETDELVALGTGPVVPIDATVTELLSQALARDPEQPAIRHRGATTTRGALQELADRCARALVDRGVTPGDVVGLMLPNSVDLLACMIGINRAGAVWLPLDAALPAHRVEHLLSETGAAIVITDQVNHPGLGSHGVDLMAELPATADPVRIGRAGDDPVYMMFTSGSTGTPKGVVQTDRALANFVVALPETLGWSAGDSVANLTTPSFDIHLLETLAALATGAVVHVIDGDEGSSPAAIADAVADVDHVQMTPTRLRLLFADRKAASRALSGIRTLIVGGEAFPSELLRDLQSHQGLKIWNVYGPTETCVWSSAQELTTETEVTIGRPVANTTFLVLDDQLRLVPAGTEGDLWIGGAGVSPGYLNRDDLTADAFRPSPIDGATIYRTGDRAAWIDGAVECRGRRDNQVKVRGHRIELDEIDAVLSSHPQVAAAATAVVTAGTGNTIIRGYYTVTGGVAVTADELRDHAAEQLPSYMVPATLTQIREMPMTASGKVDRQALASAETVTENPSPFAAAQSTVSRVLHDAWREVLGEIEFTLNDSFFDLGGNSFSLVLLMERLNRSFPDVLNVSDIFANPTLGKLRSRLESLVGDITGQHASVGVEVPQEWLTTAHDGGGHTTAEVPEALRTALTTAAAGLGRTPADLLRAAFALTLSRLIGQEQVTILVPDDKDHVHAQTFDFGGKSDLAEALPAEGAGSHRLPVTKVPSAADGKPSFAVVDGHHSDHLHRHVDVVLTLDHPTAPTSLALSYANGVLSTSMEQVLGAYLRLLTLIAAGTPSATPQEEMA